MTQTNNTSDGITLDTFLTLRYHSAPRFNADGTRLGTIREYGAATDFGYSNLCEPFEKDAIPDFKPLTSSGEVEKFLWHPTDPDSVAILEQGALVSIDPQSTRQIINNSSVAIENFDWHPDQKKIAFIRDRSVWIQNLDRGTCTEAAITDDGTVVAELQEGPALSWDPSGRYLATVVEPRTDVLRIAVLDTVRDEWIWRSKSTADKAMLHATVTWVEEGHLVFGADPVKGDRREYWSVVVDTPRPNPQLIAVDTVTQGVLLPHDPVSNQDGLLALTSPITGHHHVYVVNVKRRRNSDLSSGDLRLAGPGVSQITDGSFEARGDADDRPAWSPDGSTLAYVTNEENPGHRLLELATVDSRGSIVETQTLETIRGNSVEPVWSPTGRLAVIRATAKSPPTISLIDPDDKRALQVTEALPNGSALSDLPDPEEVTIETRGDRVRGYLYSLDREKRQNQPGIVFCHGGPIRQMREGFHPRFGYTLFHGLNQLLVQQGYTVLELNFKGSTGYGQSVQQGIHQRIGGPEFAECEAAADYLRTCPWTSDRVGVWGISYGGFLANLLASKSDEYDAAVNIAGIWDWETMMSWSLQRGPGHWGATLPTWFFNFFGGRPDDADETIHARYRDGSPKEYSGEMNCPLLALHGLADETVPVEQTYELVRDCVSEEAQYGLHIYPDEGHRFEGIQTWRDAFTQIAEFFDQYLA